MLLFSLCYDILSLTSLKITQAFHLLLGFVENQTVFWDFKIRNSVRITEGSDNGDSDNRGPTVLLSSMFTQVVASWLPPGHTKISLINHTTSVFKKLSVVG